MKIAFKRGAGSGSASSSAVLDVPEESYTAPTDWRGRGPAPAGALQRGYPEGFSPEVPYAAPVDDLPYVPRRGSFQFGLRNLPKSVSGRILLGGGAFAVLALAVGGVLGTRYYLLHDERFVVTTSADIQMSGNEHLTRAQVLSVFGADLERNIFKVPLEERRADLERLPWVAHATVMRLLPNRLRIAITERVPVAFVRQGTQIGLVDANGVLLDMPPEAAGDPHYSFPVLTGLSADDPLSTRAARMEIYHRFVQDLDSGTEKVTQSLSEVDVSNPEDVKALIPSGSTDILVHFGDEDFLTRYRSFEQHLPEWKQQYPKLASADMRYEGQIVLEMQTGAGVPLAADSAPAIPADATAQTAAALKAAAAKATPTKSAKATAKPAPTKAGAAKAKVSAELAAARRPDASKSVQAKSVQTKTPAAGATTP